MAVGRHGKGLCQGRQLDGGQVGLSIPFNSGMPSSFW